jgi:hypothetical protein
MKPFGDWIAVHPEARGNTLTELRSVSLVCPRLEKKLHPIDDAAHQPGVLLPHRKVSGGQ